VKCTLALLVALAPVSAKAADASRGEQLYQSRCGGCHAIDTHRVGPAHRGVIGRKAGSAKGYDYSAALRRAGFAWTAKRLDMWLADPQKLVPGQKMGFRLGKVDERADIIAYLETQRQRP